jgi:hypothetical protein
MAGGSDRTPQFPLAKGNGVPHFVPESGSNPDKTRKSDKWNFAGHLEAVPLTTFALKENYPKEGFA